jgi:aspartyl-tRNA(Asn)/glutamyl-tRNA(Gln) amidotransferase subunit C
MSITPDILERTATLARLSLSHPEKEAFHTELNKILDFLATLESLDTTGIEPLEHPLMDMTQPLRKDEVTEPNRRDAMQAIAPQTKDGLYLVPAVIDAP